MWLIVIVVQLAVLQWENTKKEKTRSRNVLDPFHFFEGVLEPFQNRKEASWVGPKHAHGSHVRAK